MIHPILEKKKSTSQSLKIFAMLLKTQLNHILKTF
nr:MAG TPA: hypothetical protein [Caudoviricetes sp.]